MKRRDCSPVLFWRPSRTWPAGRRRHPHRSIASLWIVLSVISVESISGIDLNHDGMSDVWQQKYSVPSADASRDYDGTGLTNSQKSLLGLDPRNPNSRFHLEIVNDSVSNQLHLRLDTVFGKLYQLESSNDLRNWTSFNSAIAGTGSTVEIIQSLTGAQMFFRARFANDIDADGDGLTAWEEHELGTSDNSSDTDGDGMPDAWEVAHGLNPNLNDANSDPDGDGISNFTEFQRGTDPHDFYNGTPPLLAIYAGGDQRGDPGTLLPVPISVVVNTYNTYNAPVTFSVVQGHALLAPDNTGRSMPQSSLSVRSIGRAIGVYGSSYVAQVWVYLPSIANEVSVIRAAAVSGANVVSVDTTAVTIDSSLSPPASFEATPTSATTVEIRWAGSTSTTTLQASTNGGATWSNVAVVGPGVSRVIVTGLQPNVSVSFRSFSGGENPTITVDGGTVAIPGSAASQAGGGGSSATASLAVTPLNHPVIEGEEKSFHLGAVGFGGFTRSGYLYLTKTAVLSYDPDNYTIFVDTIDPFTGHLTSQPPRVIGRGGSFFYLGEPNTGEVTKSDTLKVTESLPNDVDDNGNPVHKVLTVTLSDRNDETLLRQNAEGRIPAFENKFTEGSEYADFYVDNNGYEIIRLQYRWKVNADPNLTVTWDVQFTPYDGGPLHHEIHQWITQGASADPLAPYLIDPRYQRAGRNGYYDVILLQANLAVDGNRDGQMSFDDPFVRDADKTTSDKPYRFWLNDDDDTAFDYDNETGRQIGPREEEQIPPAYPDYSLHHINSKRNLEDFARLWIDLSGATDALEWGMQIGLKWRNVTGAPAINIYPSADGDGSYGYLTDDAAAGDQIAGVFNDAVRDKNDKQTVDANGIFIFKSDYWNDLSDDNPKKCLLFEGASEGKGELTIVFLDQNGNELAEGGSVWLDLKNIKDMYERAKAQPENIVAPYDLNPPFTGPVNYVPDPNGHEFQKPWDQSEQCVVFVHGWNMSYDDYISFSEIMFKRLWQQGYKGHFAAFRWDTRKSDGPFDTGEYNWSENRAFVYGTALNSLVTNLSGSYTVSIVGHSMGNIVCGEALRKGMRVRNYLLMEAAIPMSCYDTNAPQLATLVTQDQSYHTPAYHVDPADNQLTLGYGGYLNAVTGTLTNFFNPDDWALATGTTLGKNTNWEANQEDYKPDGEVVGAVHDAAWSYQYDPTYPLNQRAWVLSGEYRHVTDSWEMKSFVARSRTKAVGAIDYIGGPVGAKVNLRDDYGFGNTRPDHGGQFTRNIQKLDALYKRMRDTLEE
jgi:pimeloyl-ACP methyl ester carboxylesterase